MRTQGRWQWRHLLHLSRLSDSDVEFELPRRVLANITTRPWAFLHTTSTSTTTEIVFAPIDHGSTSYVILLWQKVCAHQEILRKEQCQSARSSKGLHLSLLVAIKKEVESKH
jgi:hypothetical protein